MNGLLEYVKEETLILVVGIVVCEDKCPAIFAIVGAKMAATFPLIDDPV